MQANGRILRSRRELLKQKLGLVDSVSCLLCPIDYQSTLSFLPETDYRPLFPSSKAKATGSTINLQLVNLKAIEYLS